jgi:hypothetical protein
MPMHARVTRPSPPAALLAGSTTREPTIGTLGPRGLAAEPSGLLGLQRLAGNAAVTSLLAHGIVQRDDKSPDTTTKASGGKSIELIFIIRKPNDQYTKDMTDYVKTTLKGQEFREVANVEDICAEGAKLASQGISLSKVRIVGHGQTVIGGVGMTPKNEKTWRFVKPEEVKAYIDTADCKALRGAMTADAEVEFWGCYLGALPEAGEAWAGLTGKPVRSTKGQIKIGGDTFTVKGKGDAKSSKDVPANVQKFFRKWLLDKYALLRSTGEAPFLKTDDEKVAHMTDLFDRSQGKIRTRVVEGKGGKGVLRPGQKGEMDMWETVKPKGNQ